MVSTGRSRCEKRPGRFAVRAPMADSISGRQQGGAVEEVGVLEGTAGGADPPESTGRPMRADAVKNRQRILEAAEAVFAAKGVAAPIDEVAERAGVGVGTLYRHFPNKEALFEAIVLTRLEELARTAAAPPGPGDAGEDFFSYLREFAAKVSNKHDLIDALGAAGIDIKSRCSAMADELASGVGRMLERAKAAGSVREGVSAEEIMGLMVGVCSAGSRRNSMRHRAGAWWTSCATGSEPGDHGLGTRRTRVTGSRTRCTRSDPVDTVGPGGPRGHGRTRSDPVDRTGSRRGKGT